MDALAMLDPTLIGMLALTIALIALLITITLAVRQNRLLNRYRMLLNGETGRDVESLLLAQGSQIEGLQNNLDNVAAQVERILADARLHVQKVGMVRFNAFPDTGSDLSFAIALLDADNNGVVLSSLYGRHESRVYAKPIQKGISTYPLSEEENEAIAKATGKKVGQP